MNTVYAIPFLLLPSSLLPSSAHFPRYAVFIYLFLTSRHMVGVYYSVYVKSEIVCLLIRYFKPLQLIFVKGIALPYWLSCFLYPFLRSSSSFSIPESHHPLPAPHLPGATILFPPRGQWAPSCLLAPSPPLSFITAFAGALLILEAHIQWFCSGTSSLALCSLHPALPDLISLHAVSSFFVTQ